MILSSIAPPPPPPPPPSLFCPVDMRPPHLSSPPHFLLPVEVLVTPMHVYAGSTGRKEDARNHSNSILSFHFISLLPTGKSCETKTYTHTHTMKRTVGVTPFPFDCRLSPVVSVLQVSQVKSRLVLAFFLEKVVFSGPIPLFFFFWGGGGVGFLPPLGPPPLTYVQVCT
ncbi:hypothetical protein GE21DRAFT_1084555 [Neurospora crassa]|nr:hypothetical protein GE21DRAFT_1084555 [Neurospora crassa]